MAEACPSAAHIVVVDDDPQVVRIMSAVLRAAGYIVDEAHDGVEALDTIADGCDLLVSDVQMPGMNGLELAERVDALYPDLQVLLCTGDPSCDDRLNHRAVLCKPFAVGELLSAVQACLASRAR